VFRVWLYHNFPHHIINETIVIKEIFKHKIIFLIFLTNSFGKASFFKKNSPQSCLIYIFVCLYVRYHYPYQKLAKHVVSLHFFKFFNNFFLQILRWERVIQCGWTYKRTAITNLILTFWKCANCLM